MTREDALLLAELKAESNQGSVYFRSSYVSRQKISPEADAIVRRCLAYGLKPVTNSLEVQKQQYSRGKVGNSENSSLSQRASRR